MPITGLKKQTGLQVLVYRVTYLQVYRVTYLQVYRVTYLQVFFFKGLRVRRTRLRPGASMGNLITGIHITPQSAAVPH